MCVFGSQSMLSKSTHLLSFVWIYSQLQIHTMLYVLYTLGQYISASNSQISRNRSINKIEHTKRQQLWLAGDFNLRGIHWPIQSTIPGGYKPGLSKEMINMVSDIGMEQMVTGPTRKGNILDLFLTTHPSLVEKSVVLPGMSDHDGIPSVVLSTKPRKIKPPPRNIYVF